MLPDDDTCPDNHPWEWLAELARERGVNCTAEDLAALPYQVVLTPELLDWLHS